MENQKLVTYNDIDVAALLSIREFEPVKASPDSANRTQFFFRDSEELQELVKTYQSGADITINLKAYNKRRKDFLFYVHCPSLLKSPKLEKEK